MSVAGKFATAARLMTSGQFDTLRRQWNINAARRRLRRHGHRPFVHRDPGFPFVCHPQWNDSVEQFLGNAGDHWEFALIRAWLLPGDSAIDAGASVGLYTFAMAAGTGDRGRVVAIEASPFVHKKLLESCSLLQTPQVLPIHAALTSKLGSVTFYIRPQNQVTFEQSLVPDPAQKADSEPVTVPALTLGATAREYVPDRIPALVKIDIEGAEADALADCPADWLADSGPMWILEINPAALVRFGASPRQIIERFPATDFDRWLLAKHPVDERSPATLHLLPDDRAVAGFDFSGSIYFNFIAVPRGSPRRQRAAALRPYFNAGLQ